MQINPSIQLSTKEYELIFFMRRVGFSQLAITVQNGQPQIVRYPVPTLKLGTGQVFEMLPMATTLEAASQLDIEVIND
uniref:Uncharacterized protein n=1 Tax=viral metagenome TaxID=1070528 RepID=A0A6H1ZJ19_9ZZZZ